MNSRPTPALSMLAQVANSTETPLSHPSPPTPTSYDQQSLGRRCLRVLRTSLPPICSPFTSHRPLPPRRSYRLPTSLTARFAPTPPSHSYTTQSERAQSVTMARVYADVNQQMPRAYWDYDSVNISWGVLENYEVVRKIGISLRTHT
jgi:hypothetical protein